MGKILEEILKNKEELLIKFLEILEGKAATARVSLDGIQFKIGESKVQLAGEVEFTFIPYEKGKKK
ncbi:MAG: hypothetical protein ACE5FW_01060 [Candidatus Aenigmatarchaeota archaeon]